MFNPVDLFINLNPVELITLIFVVLYFPRILAYFSAFSKQEHLVNKKKNRLAVLIPARNEGKTVLPLFDSLKNQTYASELFDAFVVVKEKTDPVIGYAKDYGIEAFVDESQTCKGDCLDYGFKQILEKYSGKYDAFIIVDADCVLTPSFMEEMNNSMASGADVINAKKLIKNFYLGTKKDRNIVTDLNCLIWSFMDDLGNKWKSDHGVTTMTITTGILIKAHIIESYGGWIHKSTLTEDMEFQRDCALKGFKTYYSTYAKFYIEESPSFVETNKRRMRWMDGLTHADYLYAGRLLSMKGFEAMLNNYFMFNLWIVYAFIATLLVLFSLYTAQAVLYYLFGNLLWKEAAHIAFQAISSIYLSFLVPTIIALLVNGKEMRLNPIRWLVVLIFNPISYMLYIPVQARAIVHTDKDAGWEEIARVEVE